MAAPPTTTLEKSGTSLYDRNNNVYRVHRFSLAFAQRVSTKIEHSLSGYNHIDRNILKKYFAPQRLLFCQLSWCFLPSISSMSKSALHSVVETLAIIEMYLRSSMLHGKVVSQRELTIAAHEQNTQMILFGDMLISACVNQAFHLKNPVLKRELNLLVYQLGIKSVNFSLKQKKTQNSIFPWVDWLSFIPKLITVIDNNDHKKTSRINAINAFFTGLAKKTTTNMLIPTPKKEKSLNPLLAILENLSPEISRSKHASFNALMFQFFSTITS